MHTQSAGGLTVGRFATELLNKLNETNKNYFRTLEILPTVLPYSNFAPIELNQHPLVLIESQMTLYKLKNILNSLTTSNLVFSEDNIKLLQDEVLTKRYHRLCDLDNNASSDAYFYGAPLPFKANEACIEVAKKFETYFATIDNKLSYAHYLIPDLIDTLSDNFKFEGHVLKPVSINREDGVTLVNRGEPAPTKLSIEDCKELYNVLYGGMVTLEDLINRLYAHVPQNTWELYFSCYNTENLLILAIDKPDIKPDQEYSDQEFNVIKERIKTFLSNTTKYQEDLRLLDTSSQRRMVFDQAKPNAERWMKAAYFVLISLSSRIRSILPDFLGTGGWLTGYSKQKRLEEAQTLLTFLTLDLPLKKLPNWLDTSHKDVKARLLSSTTSGRYGKFYIDILQNAEKHLKTTENKTVTDTMPKKSGWFGMRFG